ncbi:MAG TPA: hypothetical protein VFB22_04280, partial [Candidatus Baltobacteraceae bacterium]|nr:hypothetical protein [Candidatus Baltobacteraceae bacterium]
TPTPVPTPTPTPGPPMVLEVNPPSMQLYGTGSANAKQFNVQESDYTNVFTHTDTCSGIATVTPTSASGPDANFTVTGQAAGQCSVTFKDFSGQHKTVSVTVTTNPIVIEGARW